MYLTVMSLIPLAIPIEMPVAQKDLQKISFLLHWNVTNTFSVSFFAGLLPLVLLPMLKQLLVWLLHVTAAINAATNAATAKRV